jgi:hypothetical protein
MIPEQQIRLSSISTEMALYQGSFFRKNSIHADVSTSILSKAFVSVPEPVGGHRKFHVPCRGFDPFLLLQSYLITDGGNNRFGFALRLNLGHKFVKEIAR